MELLSALVMANWPHTSQLDILGAGEILLAFHLNFFSITLRIIQKIPNDCLTVPHLRVCLCGSAAQLHLKWEPFLALAITTLDTVATCQK